MDFQDHHQWFYDQPTAFDSLDAMVSENLDYPHLSPIPEQEWDFSLEGPQEDPQLSSYACLDQILSPVAHEGAADEAVAPQVLEELSNLLDQVKRLRHDISELQEIFSKRLDSMEKSVMVAQRYVNSLVPWSMEVHEKYSKLLEVAERQEKKGTDSCASNATDT